MPKLAKDYKPASAIELIDDLPTDTILRAENKMRDGSENAVKGHPIMSLPAEFLWVKKAPVESDVTYTFILEIVHRELKRFAERLDKYFVLVPKDGDE